MAPHAFFFALCLAFATLSVERASANPFLGSEATPEPPATSRSSSPFTGAQFYFRRGMAAEFSRLGEGTTAPALVALLAGSFLFGLLHSAGPGHRKSIIFWLFIGRKTKPYQPLAAGFLSAAVHSATGAALVGALGVARGTVASLADTGAAGIWMDGLTFLAVAAASTWFGAQSAIEFFRGPGHGHGAGGRSLYSYVIVASLAPCPASIMILLFTIYLDIMIVGLLSLAAAAVGIGVTITVVGYAAWLGRERLFALFKLHGRLVGRLSSALEFAASLTIFSVSIYTAWPFVTSWLRL